MRQKLIYSEGECQVSLFSQVMLQCILPIIGSLLTSIVIYFGEKYYGCRFLFLSFIVAMFLIDGVGGLFVTVTGVGGASLGFRLGSFFFGLGSLAFGIWLARVIKRDL